MESFVTDIAYVRLYGEVSPSVFEEMIGTIECFLAYPTSVWLLVSVGQFMFPEAAAVTETFITHVTDVRLLASMC